MEPENIENDFFGSVDNGSDKIGYFEAATNGTIFIDEVKKCLFRLRQKY